jgi:predicted ArsR family transcriptional regulator
MFSRVHQRLLANSSANRVNTKAKFKMAKSAWKRKFFETTRGQIVQLLCKGPRTVAELAGQLMTSENAVRSQLAILETEGLVVLSGKRPGTRKPHFSYELTPKAHDLFKKGYEPILVELLDVLAQRNSAASLHALALEVGHRFIEGYFPKVMKQKPASRLKTLVAKSCEIGVPLNLIRENGEVTIRGCSCPLASVIKRKPELCNVVAQLLSEILERPVQQSCEHGPAPRCEFKTRRPETLRLANTPS